VAASLERVTFSITTHQINSLSAQCSTTVKHFHLTSKLMGRSRYKIYQSDVPHFLTCTINNWIPLFTRPATVEIILEALAYRQQHRAMQVYAYVILENHLHLVAQAPDLPKEIAIFKSWTARQLIAYLQANNAVKLLEQFAFHKRKHKADRDYQVWEEGSHPQQIQTEAMMRQKVEYVHYNPVKRGYVDKAEDWRYSSARNYLGNEGLIKVTTAW
jgi:REP element-mobilizing transposase RayT